MRQRTLEPQETERSDFTRPSVTLGRVVGVNHDRRTQPSWEATVDVGSTVPLSFTCEGDPPFAPGDLVAVTHLDDDEPIDGHQWIAHRSTGRWRLCSAKELGFNDSPAVLVVRPGMQLKTAPAPALGRRGGTETTNRFDMLVVPSWGGVG